MFTHPLLPPEMSACKVCLKSNGKLFACKGCKEVIYCSLDHAAADWPVHQNFCSVVSAMPISMKVPTEWEFEDFGDLMKKQVFNSLKKNTENAEQLDKKLEEGTFYFRLGSPHAKSQAKHHETIDFVYKRSGMLEHHTFFPDGHKHWEDARQRDTWKDFFEIVQSFFDISSVLYEIQMEDKDEVKKMEARKKREETERKRLELAHLQELRKQEEARIAELERDLAIENYGNK
jgi:hypothetical protein